jgi:WD40 repeat protein
LASVRDEAVLQKLPREERDAWRDFWRQVAAARRQQTESAAASAGLVAFTAICRLEGHTNGIGAVAISPDGRNAVTADWDGRAFLWRLPSGAKVRAFGTPGGHIAHVAFTADSKAVVLGGLHRPQLWRLQADAAERTFEGPKKFVVNTLALTPDGRRVLAAGGEGDSVIHSWERDSGRPGPPLEGHRDWVGSLAVSPDGTKLFSFGGDAIARLRDLSSGTVLGRFDLRFCQAGAGVGGSTAFSADGKLVLAPYDDRFLRVWDVETKGKVWDFEHRGRVRSIAVLADNCRVLSVSLDGKLRLWSLKTGKLLGEVDLSEPLACVAVDPHGRYVITGAVNSPMVRVWRIDPRTTTPAPAK